LAGFAPGRSLPRCTETTLSAWHRRNANRVGPFPNGRVHLFCDEFTNYNDTAIGIKAVQLLNRLGYES
jgi:Fe-S oxidoreductase